MTPVIGTTYSILKEDKAVRIIIGLSASSDKHTQSNEAARDRIVNLANCFGDS